MDCWCCVGGNGQWREDYKKKLCQECWEVLKEMERFRRRESLVERKRNLTSRRSRAAKACANGNNCDLLKPPPA